MAMTQIIRTSFLILITLVVSVSVSRAAYDPSPYSPLQYGGKCDGVTDTTSAIQSAVNAAEAAVGGIVQLPPGNCVTSGSISITGSGIHFTGYGSTSTTITPSSGSFNIISFSGSGSAQDGSVEDLSFNMANMSGGNAVSINAYNRVTIRDVSSFNTKNFLYDQSSNWMLANDVTVFGVSGSYCFEVVAPGSARSDDMNFVNVACGGATGSTYIGLIENGYVNTINVHNMAFSAPNGGGILVENTNSGSEPPQYNLIHDFQVEQASGGANGINLQAAFNFYCANCYSSSNTGDGLYIGSSASDVNFVNPFMELNEKYGIETHAAAGGTGTTGTVIAGGNVSANSDTNTGTYANILIGATAYNTIISGVQLGGSTVPYGVTVQSGALYTSLSNNNYTGATSGSVDDLSGDAQIIGGTDYAGVAYGPTISDGGHNGLKQLNFSNAGTQSGSISQVTVTTGTADANGFLSETDGTNPVVTLGNGTGDSGGLNITAAAGNIGLTVPSGKSIYSNGTAGVSCSGSPSGSFASVNGIVTHC